MRTKGRPLVDRSLRFPSDADVVAEEAGRFRLLSPTERMASIRSVVAAGELLLARSPRREFLQAYRQRQEDLARQAVREFTDRHAKRL
jgi:hypothetical protein